MSEQEKRGLEVAELAKRVAESIGELRRALGVVDVQAVMKVVERLDRLRDDWYVVYECLFGRCELRLSEQYARVRLTLPISLLNVSTEVETERTLKEALGAVRSKVIEVFTALVMETASALYSVLGNAKSEIEKLVATNESLMRRLNDLESRVKEIEREIDRALEEIEE